MLLHSFKRKVESRFVRNCDFTVAITIATIDIIITGVNNNVLLSAFTPWHYFFLPMLMPIKKQKALVKM
jgi:hypothetical protein